MKSKGKTIGSGGYGVPHSTILLKAQDCPTDNGSQAKAKATDASTSVYLFVEEALYLHERGMIEVYHPLVDTETEHQNQMTTQEIYNLMLNTLNVPLSVYLTYASLRSQTYIVLRHTDNRLNIIRNMEQGCNEKLSKPQPQPEHQNEELSSGGTKRKRNHPGLAVLKKELRSDSFLAPCPMLMRYNADECSVEKSISFDVYNPNTNFRKTMPGLPNFCVVVTALAEPSPPFSVFKRIIQSCEGIPLKVATVSDLGTIAMFGMTDYGVPPIVKTADND